MNSTSIDNPASSSGEPTDDPEFLRAVQEFLSLLESGAAPDRREFVRRFPGFGQALDKCLAGLEAVHVAAAPRKSRPMLVTPSESHLAKPLGDFQIHREIGRGGMGIVYEATQLSLGRKVALKVLPFAATFDAKHLQRFRNEAQAAAQLHHANIVPVFAVGSERGVHFYAMQLIEGQSLSVMIDQFRDQSRVGGGRDRRAETDLDATAPTIRPPSRPDDAIAAPSTILAYSGTLSTQLSKNKKDYFRSVARLFIQAAGGLDHAHQVGIVHRDIKPANLLLDSRGNLWITDFGLAQFRSEANLTKTGDLVGTIRYMSPEQASGNRAILDHRSDIYSLGATLYELATLKPIFDDQDSIGLLRQIANDEPIAPRRHEPALPVELETIILKSVSKTPSDRYATALDLTADLQRFLDDQPILARRPTVIEKARKWSRRHPAVLATAVGFLIFCILGLSLSNWLIAQEQEKTRRALVGERKRSEEAERRFAQARQSVDLLIQVAEDELAGQPQLQAARKKVLQTALAFYQDLIEQRADAPESQAELARDQNKVRQLLSDLTTLEGAQRLELLAEPSVQDDLGLDDEQRGHARDFTEKWSKERTAFFRDSRNLPFDQRQQQFLALLRVNDDALAGVLSESQLNRLRQIALQVKGLFAFEDPDVIAALQLSPKQKSQIREIHSALMDKVFDKGPGQGPGFENGGFDKRFGKGPGGPNSNDRGKGPGGDWGKGPNRDFGPFRNREEAAHRAGVEKAKSVLTADQRARWSQLVGPAFTGSTRSSPAFTIPFAKDRHPKD